MNKLLENRKLISDASFTIIDLINGDRDIVTVCDYDVVINGKTIHPEIVIFRPRGLSIVNTEVLKAEKPPELVIELGSISDGELLSIKRGVYAELGIEEYWVIDLNSKVVVQFTLKGGTYGGRNAIYTGDCIEHKNGIMLNVDEMFYKLKELANKKSRLSA